MFKKSNVHTLKTIEMNKEITQYCSNLVCSRVELFNSWCLFCEDPNLIEINGIRIPQSKHPYDPNNI